MRFREHTALDDISTAIEQDAITGLLGRNGAEKTTSGRSRSSPASGSRWQWRPWSPPCPSWVSDASLPEVPPLARSKGPASSL
jgi:hypothetical protein